MEVSVCRDEASLHEVAPSWMVLANVAARSPFQTFQWCSTWWDVVGRRRASCELHVVIVREGSGRPLALAPFMRVDDRDGTLRLLSDPFADYLDVLVDPRATHKEVGKLLAEYLHEGLGTEWRTVVLDELAPGSLFLLLELGQYGRDEEASTCPRRTLASAPPARNEYMLKRRRLGRLGQVNCELHVEPTPISDRMGSFMAMHLRQWACRPDRGLTFDDDDMVRFYYSMVEPLAHSGLLALAELTLDGTPLAFHLGFLFDETFWGYRTTYETRYARFSPGHVLHLELFEVLQRAGVRTFDFMRGTGQYKYDYATHHVVNRRVVFESEL